jgi:hypothetical protein
MTLAPYEWLITMAFLPQFISTARAMRSARDCRPPFCSGASAGGEAAVVASPLCCKGPPPGTDRSRPLCPLRQERRSTQAPTPAAAILHHPTPALDTGPKHQAPGLRPWEAARPLPHLLQPLHADAPVVWEIEQVPPRHVAVRRLEVLPQDAVKRLGLGLPGEVAEDRAAVGHDLRAGAVAEPAGPVRGGGRAKGSFGLPSRERLGCATSSRPRRAPSPPPLRREKAPPPSAPRRQPPRRRGRLVPAAPAAHGAHLCVFGSYWRLM